MDSLKFTSTPIPFHCPNCGAGLQPGSEPTITCQYCGSTVLVPPEYRSEEPGTSQAGPEPIVIHIGDPNQSRQVRSHTASRAVLVIGIMVAIFLAFGFLAAVLLGAGVFATTRVVQESVDEISTVVYTLPPELNTALAVIPSAESTVLAPTETPRASLALQFGSQGSAPGQFQDPRQITVDKNGNIYVSDFESGRVQVFDPQGKFVRQVQVDGNRNGSRLIFDLAVDYEGNLYVIRAGDILVFESDTGQPASPILASFPTTFYYALAIDPTNTIQAITQSLSGGDDIVRMDREGGEIARAENVIQSIEPGESCECNSIAVDGLGNSFVMSVFDPQVFVYSTEGSYLDRLGSPGRGPGQLEDSGSLVVDGQGRIYLIDSGEIEILDQSGVPLDSIPWDYRNGSPRDLALDLEGNLYTVTSNGLVIKYSLNWDQ